MYSIGSSQSISHLHFTVSDVKNASDSTVVLSSRDMAGAREKLKAVLEDVHQTLELKVPRTRHIFRKAHLAEDIPLREINGEALYPMETQSSEKLGPRISYDTPTVPFDGSQMLHIQPLPERKRRKFSVPCPPAGKAFYRTISHRVVHEEELLSESDDDVDETWQLQEHDSMIDSISTLSNAKKRFIKLWDRHFFNERLSGRSYLGAAMKRFVSANKQALSERDLWDEFFEKACALKREEEVTEAIMYECLKMINDEYKHNNGTNVQLVPESSPESVFDQGDCKVCRDDVDFGQALLCSQKVIRRRNVNYFRSGLWKKFGADICTGLLISALSSELFRA